LEGFAGALCGALAWGVGGFGADGAFFWSPAKLTADPASNNRSTNPISKLFSLSASHFIGDSWRINPLES
jgi:hypothetical protein